MSERIEGTVVLDGMIEGRLPEGEAVEVRLREWIDLVGQLRLRFSLEIEGGHFSILADPAPVLAAGLAPEPSEAIRTALQRLLDVFEGAHRSHLFSTVRSVEYRPGLEVQTVYAVTPEGAVDARERTLEADTTAPLSPLSRREKVRLALIGVGAALALVGVSALFVDYPAIIADLIRSAASVDPEEVEVDASALEEYLTVERRFLARGGRQLVLTLRRTRSFPLDQAAIERASSGGSRSLASRLALEAIARGYIRCELYDEKGGFLESTVSRVKDLRRCETVDVALPIPGAGRPARIVLTY